MCVKKAWWILLWLTHNTNYTGTYLNLVPVSIRLCDKLVNYNNGIAPHPWLHTALRPDASSSFSLFILLSTLIIWPFSFTVCSPKTMQLLTSQQHFWVRDSDSACLAVSPCLIPAWAQLKHFPCPSAHKQWWLLFALNVRCQCEVFIMRFLRKLYLIWQDFYFEGPSLKSSFPFLPPSHNPRPKKGEKYVGFIFTWLHEAHAERQFLTLYEAHRFSRSNTLYSIEYRRDLRWVFTLQWFLRARTKVIPESWD